MLNATRLKFYVSDEEIYQFYFGDFNLIDKYYSPWRSERTPSLSFNKFKGKIYWKDFGSSSDVPKDAIGMVQMMYDLPRDIAINKIWKEMVKDKDAKIVKPKLVPPLKLPYTYKTKEWEDFEYAYWKQFEFTKDFLTFFDVYPLKGLYKAHKLKWTSTPEDPAYVYVFDKDNRVFKCYRPLNKNKEKFRGINVNNTIEGFNKLPETFDHLFVTSSYKDTMVLRKMGFVACNPTSETARSVLVEKKQEINERFKEVIILFDNDYPGIESTKRLQRDTNWGSFFIPEKTGVKDPSDLVLKKGGYLDLYKILSKFKFNKFKVV